MLRGRRFAWSCAPINQSLYMSYFGDETFNIEKLEEHDLSKPMQCLTEIEKVAILHADIYQLWQNQRPSV